MREVRFLETLIEAGLAKCYVDKTGTYSEQSVAFLVSSMAEAFLDFAELDGQPGLVEALSLWQCIRKGLQPLQNTPATKTELPQLHSLRAAADRLADLIQNGGAAFIKTSIEKAGGLKAAMNLLDKEFKDPLPTGLGKYLHAVRTCSAWGEKALDTSLVADAEPNCLQMHLNTFTKAQGLDMSFLETTLPESCTAVTKFMDNYKSKLAEWLKKLDINHIELAGIRLPCPFTLYRSVVGAIERWDLDSVSWVFSGGSDQNKKVTREVKSIESTHKMLGHSLPLLRALALTSKHADIDIGDCGEKVAEIQKSVQDNFDFRATAAMILAVVSAADLFINPDNHPDPKASQVKIVQFMAATLGISKSDLPESLRSRMEPPPPEEEPNKRKPAPKRKRVPKAQAELEGDEEQDENVNKRSRKAANPTTKKRGRK
ncbi:unnamed protein product [Durusdinium trenchii]|uniref:Uncharacterized protein n=1 Tax=Durusdinium trenchii TaxID=1381693 RepID=A0ABP0QJP8_9DINO